MLSAKCSAQPRKKKAKGKAVTLDDCIRVGLGQLRLDPTSFYDMTFADFQLAAEGFYNLEERRQQTEWERTRWLGALLLSPHSKPGKSIKPHDIATFPWEKKSKSKGNNQLLKNALKRATNGQAKRP